MGSVWRAHHEGLGIDVAVKFIAKDLLESENPLVVARFSREAKLVARLDSHHIVRVMDHGIGDHGPFIVMELLRGQSLGDKLLAQQRIAPEEAVEIMNQVANGLEHAHAHDIVHRDVKPANIFLCQEKSGVQLVKLLDFGIAKSDKLAEAMGAATATGGLIGTPQYMSPEQLMRAGPVTPAVDLWALGVVAFEMLTGKLPFAGETLAATLVAITRAEPPSPRQSVPGLSSDLDRFFKRALHPEPSRRFTSAREMAEAFAAATSGSSPPSIREPALPITDPNLATSEFLALQTPPRLDDAGAFAPTLPQEGATRPPVRRRGMLVPGVAALALAGVVGVVLLTRRDPPPATAATESSPPSETIADVTSVPTSNETAPTASASSPPIAVLANLPLTKIPEGTGTLAATFFPGFEVMREPGDENASLRGAQDACERKQMSLCTEGQWLRACEAIPALGTAPSWTLTGSVDGVVVRGGQGACTDKAIVAPTDKAAARVGVCCTRAVGMTSLTNPSTPFLKSVGAQILQVERLLNSSNGFEFSRVSAAEVNFFGKRFEREELRDVIIQFGRSSSNYFGHCSVDIRTTPTSKGWLAECSGLQFGGKAVVAFTRILRSTEGALDELREARNPRTIPSGAITVPSGAVAP